MAISKHTALYIIFNLPMNINFVNYAIRLDGLPNTTLFEITISIKSLKDHFKVENISEIFL